MKQLFVSVSSGGIVAGCQQGYAGNKKELFHKNSFLVLVNDENKRWHKIV